MTPDDYESQNKMADKIVEQAEKLDPLRKQDTKSESSEEDLDIMMNNPSFHR